MTAIVPFTSHRGKTVYINLAHVRILTEANDEAKTQVHFDADHTIIIDVPLDQAAQRMASAG